MCRGNTKTNTVNAWIIKIGRRELYLAHLILITPNILRFVIILLCYIKLSRVKKLALTAEWVFFTPKIPRFHLLCKKHAEYMQWGKGFNQ